MTGESVGRGNVRDEATAALRSDVERVDFIERLYGAVMADRMRQMFDAVPDDGTCDGFAQSVRRSIDGEMEDFRERWSVNAR